MLCIRLNNNNNRLLGDDDFVKKIIFSDETHFDLGGYVNKQNCRIWGTENPHAYIETPTHTKRITVCADFGPEGSFFENEPGKAVTVNGNRYRGMLNEFSFTKIKEKDIGNIRFNRKALRVTQSKLHSMFCDLFLKIPLPAAGLMSFGHLGAAI